MRNSMMSRRGDDRTSETIEPLTRKFDDAVAATRGLMMVDFCAECSGLCRDIEPVLDDVTEAAGGRMTTISVKVDENPALAARYNVRSIPTVVFFKDGAVVDRVIGPASKALLQYIVDARTGTVQPRSGDSHDR
jgi:thioredoxin